MENTEHNKKNTLSEAAKSLGIEIEEAAGILERYANLSNLNEDSEISKWHYSVLEGIVRTRAEEKEKLESELNLIKEEPPLFPPEENAMCYCQASPDWHDSDDDKGKNFFLVLAIILAAAIVLAIVLV